MNSHPINALPLDDEEAYQLWLRDPTATIMHLVELDYVGDDGGGWPATYTLLLSDRPYPPAHPVVDAIPSVSVQIGEEFTGAVSASLGSLVLRNTAGALDAWLLLNIDGRQVRVYHGAPDWPRERFRRINTCLAEQVATADDGRIEIRLRGLDAGANGPIQTNLVSSGANANQPVPLAYGHVFNVEPVLTDAASATYQWHDGPVQSVDAVRDSGIDFQTASATISAVNAGTDTLTTAAAHGFGVSTRVRFAGTPPAPLAAATDYFVISAGLTTTEFRVAAAALGPAIDITGSTTGATVIGYHWTADLSLGTIQLTSAVAGQLTLDGHGHAPASGYSDDPADIALAILGAVNVDEAMLERFQGEYALAVGLYVRERRNRLDVVGQLLSGVGGWYGYDRQGFLRLGRVAADPGYRHIDIAENELVAPISIVRMIPPRMVHRCGYQHNWTPQSTGLAAGVTATNRAIYAGEYRVVGALSYPYPFPATNVQSHALAVRPDVVDTLVDDSLDAYDLAVRLNAVYAGWGVVYAIEVGPVGYTIDIGDVVRLTHARYGLDAGLDMTVIRREDEPTARRVRLQLFAQRGTYAPGQL